MIYDYHVTFLGMSPYLQAEVSPLERLRVTAGLRYDHIGYDYRSRLGEQQKGMTGGLRAPTSPSPS